VYHNCARELIGGKAPSESRALDIVTGGGGAQRPSGIFSKKFASQHRFTGVVTDGVGFICNPRLQCRGVAVGLGRRVTGDQNREGDLEPSSL